MAVEQTGVGLEKFEHFGEAARGEVVGAADARALLQMDRRAKALRGEHLVCDLERLFEADWPAQPAPADLQEDLVRDVVVRGAEQRDEDLRKGTRLSMNIDRLQSSRYGSSRDVALHAAASALDECGDQLAGILETHRRAGVEFVGRHRLRPRPYSRACRP